MLRYNKSGICTFWNRGDIDHIYVTHSYKVDIGSGNGMMPEGTKPFTDTILTYHQKGHLSVISRDISQSLTAEIWICLKNYFKTFIQIFQGLIGAWEIHMKFKIIIFQNRLRMFCSCRLKYFSSNCQLSEAVMTQKDHCTPLKWNAIVVLLSTMRLSHKRYFQNWFEKNGLRFRQFLIQ